MELVVNKKSKQAISFLCKTPSEETLSFAQIIYEVTKLDVYVISDNEFKDNHVIAPNVKAYTIADSVCINNGYHNSNINSDATHIKKNPIAYDKFFYFFCEINTTYDFVFVFEDDCFIPSVSAIIKLMNKYNSYDLVTPNNFKKEDNLMDWHWRHIIDKIQPPYYYSMVCACGISRNLFNVIKQYKEKNNSLFYIEVMLNTLAMQNNLKVTDADELKSIVWMGEWGIDEFLLLPNNIFHPRKDLIKHSDYRIQIEKLKGSNYKPVNNLPAFIKLN